MLQTLVRMGETTRAEQGLASPDETSSGERRIALAVLRLAQRDPQAATAALVPVLDGSVTGSHQVWQIAAFLLEASARDALGEGEAAGRCQPRPGRSPRPAPPADEPFRAGDRPRALCVGEHDPDAHAGTCTTSSAPIAAWRSSTGPVLLAFSPSRNGPEPSFNPFCGMKLAPA